MVVAGCEIMSGSGSDRKNKKKGDLLVLEGPHHPFLTAHGLILHGRGKAQLESQREDPNLASPTLGEEEKGA